MRTNRHNRYLNYSLVQYVMISTDLPKTLLQTWPMLRMTSNSPVAYKSLMAQPTWKIFQPTRLTKGWGYARRLWRRGLHRYSKFGCRYEFISM